MVMTISTVMTAIEEVITGKTQYTATELKAEHTAKHQHHRIHQLTENYNAGTGSTTLESKAASMLAVLRHCSGFNKEKTGVESETSQGAIIWSLVPRKAI